MTAEAHDVTSPRREPVEAAQPLTFATDPTGHPVTADMARGLIATVRTIRPGWKSRQIAEALDQVRDQDPVAVTLALIAAARNPNVTHPGVVASNGVWWDAAETYPPASRTGPRRPAYDDQTRAEGARVHVVPGRPQQRRPPGEGQGGRHQGGPRTRRARHHRGVTEMTVTLTRSPASNGALDRDHRDTAGAGRGPTVREVPDTGGPEGVPGVGVEAGRAGLGAGGAGGRVHERGAGPPVRARSSRGRGVTRRHIRQMLCDCPHRKYTITTDTEEGTPTMAQEPLDLPTPKLTIHGSAVYYGTDREDHYLGWVDQGTTGKWWGQSRYTDTSLKARLYGDTRQDVLDQLLDIHLNR